MFVAWRKILKDLVCLALASISIGYDNILLNNVITEILDHSNIITPDL